MLVPWVGRWSTTKNEAATSADTPAKSSVSASTPPAEAPTTTMSRFATVVTLRARAASFEDTPAVDGGRPPEVLWGREEGLPGPKPGCQEPGIGEQLMLELHQSQRAGQE